MKDYKRLTIRNDDGTWGVNYLELANEVAKWQEQHPTQYFATDLTNILGEKLAELEDKIENGTLIELPCKGERANVIAEEFEELIRKQTAREILQGFKTRIKYMPKNNFTRLEIDWEIAILAQKYGIE